MNNFESHIRKEEEIAHHKTESHNRNENQIRLMTKLFEETFHTKINFEDKKQKVDVITYWNENGYAQAYQDLEESEVFKRHQRLQGNILEITVEDVKSFLETGTLPEEIFK